MQYTVMACSIERTGELFQRSRVRHDIEPRAQAAAETIHTCASHILFTKVPSKNKFDADDLGVTIFGEVLLVGAWGITGSES